MLKGASILIRKHVLKFLPGHVWLAPDMKSVKWYWEEKGRNVFHEIDLTRVHSMKFKDRDISLQTLDDTRDHPFIFYSKEISDMWVNGLSILLASRTTIKARGNKNYSPEPYDVMKDKWYGKPVAAKRRMGTYVCLGSIGSGAFGSVTLALHLGEGHCHEFYAIKFLSKTVMRRQMRNSKLERTTNAGIANGHSSGEGTEEEAPMEVNEIVIMEQLKHPNVVQMREVVEDEESDSYCIVIEYMANGPIMSSQKLKDALQMKEAKVRPAIVDVLAGLSYLHAHGIVHRDIKPDNLLRAGDSKVKISDFGSAKKYADSGEDSNSSIAFNPAVGTPAFTAPELCISDSAPRAPARVYAADIWSLGASLYYMVYGRAPFLATSVFEMYDVICTKDLVFPPYPDVSQDCQKVIKAMLRKKPEDRATIDEILRMPWISTVAVLADKVAEIRESRRAERGT